MPSIDFCMSEFHDEAVEYVESLDETQTSLAPAQSKSLDSFVDRLAFYYQTRGADPVLDELEQVLSNRLNRDVRLR